MIVVGMRAQTGTPQAVILVLHLYSAIGPKIFATICPSGPCNVMMANCGSLTITVLMSSQIWEVLKAYWNTLSSKALPDLGRYVLMAIRNIPHPHPLLGLLWEKASGFDE